jgi:hypothetical protein
LPVQNLLPVCSRRCGGVVWPTCGNPSARWFRLYFTMPLFYITTFVCNVNIATSSPFDHKPRFTQPVQGSRPEGIRCPFAPSPRKVASGQFSHQYPRIRIARPHTLSHDIFAHFYSGFSPLSHSKARDLFLHSFPIVRSTATRITDPKQEPTGRANPSATAS